MGLPRFEYFSPRSIDEVCRLLKERGTNAVVMAGGTDLLIKMKKKVLNPSVVIGLKRIPELNTISYNPRKGLTIGATALLSDVARHPAIRKKYPAISESASNTGTVQIRNMGTVAGNLCNASPSADNAPALIAYGAKVILRSTNGEREVPLEEFFKAPGVTVMNHDEVLTNILVPPPVPLSGCSYKAISRRSKVDISAVIVSVFIQAEKGRCKDARIVLGAVAPIPMRAKKAEKILIGKKLTPSIVEKAALQASKESKPITDMRASASYRKQMVEVLSRRAIKESARMAGMKV